MSRLQKIIDSAQYLSDTEDGRIEVCVEVEGFEWMINQIQKKIGDEENG